MHDSNAKLIYCTGAAAFQTDILLSTDSKKKVTQIAYPTRFDTHLVASGKAEHQVGFERALQMHVQLGLGHARNARSQGGGCRIGSGMQFA